MSMLDIIRSRVKSLKIVSLLWVGTILGSGIGFLTQVLLARNLGTESFGLFSAALGMVNLLVPLAGFGIAGFWLKIFGQEGWRGIRWLPASFKFIFLSTATVAIAMLLWAEFGPNDEQTKSVLKIFLWLLLGSAAVELFSAKLQLEERFGVLAIWQILPGLLKFLAVIGLMLFINEKLILTQIAWAYAVVSISMIILVIFPLLLMFRGDFSLKGHGGNVNGVPIDSVRVIDVISESWAFGLAGMFHFVYFQGSVLIIKYMLGDVSAGLYSSAFLIVSVVYIFPSVIYNKFLYPKIHRYANSDLDSLYKIYIYGSRLMFGFGVVVSFVLCFISPFVFPLLFGEDFLPAVDIILVLAIAIPVRFLATSIGSMLLTKNNVRIKVVLMGFVAIISIPLNIFLVRLYDVQGAAIATVIAELLLLALYVRVVRSSVFK